MHHWQRTLCKTGFAVTKISLNFDEVYIESVLGKIDVIRGSKYPPAKPGALEM